MYLVEQGSKYNQGTAWNHPDDAITAFLLSSAVQVRITHNGVTLARRTPKTRYLAPVWS